MCTFKPFHHCWSILKSSVAVAVVQSTAARPPVQTRVKIPGVASVHAPLGVPVSRRCKRKIGSLKSPALMTVVYAPRYENGPRDTRKAPIIIRATSTVGYACG